MKRIKRVMKRIKGKVLVFLVFLVFCFLESNLFLGYSFGFWGKELREEEKQKLKLEAERKALEKEYLKILRFLVEEYKELEMSEKEISQDKDKNVKKEGFVFKSGMSNSTEGMSNSTGGGVEVVVKKGEMLMQGLDRCGVGVRLYFKNPEDGKKFLNEKLSIVLERDYRKDECDKVILLAKERIKDFLVSERQAENKTLWEISDYYMRKYRVGRLVEKAKQKIKDYLVREDAKAVVYPDGRVEVWDCKKGHEKVESFLRDLVVNEHYLYSYELLVRVGKKEYRYSGDLLPNMESKLGIDGFLIGGTKIKDPVGEILPISIYFYKDGELFNNVVKMHVGKGELEKKVWGGNLYLEIKLTDKSQGLLEGLVDKELVYFEESVSLKK